MIVPFTMFYLLVNTCCNYKTYNYLAFTLIIFDTYIPYCLFITIFSSEVHGPGQAWGASTSAACASSSPTVARASSGRRRPSSSDWVPLVGRLVGKATNHGYHCWLWLIIMVISLNTGWLLLLLFLLLPLLLLIVIYHYCIIINRSKVADDD